ncbi:hypothetical protein CPC08DRAFT_702057 [Agrocybe pediades]|nr:hypothetical protein CPC08DRAFT_702057 [Agrocybe pediades]
MHAPSRRTSGRVLSLVVIAFLSSLPFSLAQPSVQPTHLEQNGSFNETSSGVSSVSSSGLSSSSSSAIFSSSFFSSTTPSSTRLPPSSTSPSITRTSAPSSRSPTSSTFHSSSSSSIVQPPSSSSQQQSSISLTTTTPSKSITTQSPSSTTRSGGPLNGVPLTTLSLVDNFIPTHTTSISTSASVDLSPTSTNSSAENPPEEKLSKNFWEMKGAVAATFVMVSLVIIAVIGVLVFFWWKRRRARQLDELMNDDMFEKFTEPDQRTSSPDPSIGATPMDPFASTYAASQPFQGYVLPSQVQSNLLTAPTYPVQHPDYYSTPSTSHQTVAVTPSKNTPQQVGTSPSYRNPATRGSYQPSVDSFYGAAGQS